MVVNEVSLCDQNLPVLSQGVSTKLFLPLVFSLGWF